MKKHQDYKNGKKLTLTNIIVFSVFVLLFVEMILVLINQLNINKRPVLVGKWEPSYKQQAGMPVFKENLYIIDTGANQVKRHNKLDGTLIEIFNTENRPVFVVESSVGDVYIAEFGTGGVFKYINGKKEEFISFPGIKEMIGLAINSKDNFIAGDYESGKIFIYDLSGNVIKQFAGIGANKGKFKKLGKVFTDGEDNIYAFDTGYPLRICIFDKQGGFKRDFSIRVKRFFGPESIVVTNDGNIYVSNLNNNSIDVFNSRGLMIGNFNTALNSDYRIGAPGAFSGGSDGRLYVGSNFVAVFEAIRY